MMVVGDIRPAGIEILKIKKIFLWQYYFEHIGVGKVVAKNIPENHLLAGQAPSKTLDPDFEWNPE